VPHAERPGGGTRAAAAALQDSLLSRSEKNLFKENNLVVLTFLPLTRFKNIALFGAPEHLSAFGYLI
jgi:hypothetical protein